MSFAGPFFFRCQCQQIFCLKAENQTMGCFTVLKSKKKKTEQTMYVKGISSQESRPSPSMLPEPQMRSRLLHSAPPSFRTRVKPSQPVKRLTNNRIRALSAPSSLDAAEQDALSSVVYDVDESTNQVGSASMKEQQRSPSPQPLPLPAPQSASVLKTTGSFKSVNGSGPLVASSGPLPLPRSGTLRSFSYEEISSACNSFSSDRCMSEGLSSMKYKASFGDEGAGSKKLEATVTRLHPSPQVILSFFLFRFFLQSC